MKKNIKALFVEDSIEDQLSFGRNIKKLNKNSNILNVSYKEAASQKEMFEYLRKESFDILLLDLSLPDSDQLTSLSLIIEEFGNQLPIIVLTGYESEELAVEAIQKGSQDYLLKKELTPYTLSRSIMYALERNNMLLELEEIRMQQAESLKMATLGEMAGGIAHEINNPLTIILGYISQIKRSANKEEDIEKLLEYSEKIENVTNRIAKIVKSLRGYSRKEDNDPKEVTSLENILNDAFNLCSERLKSGGIDLVVNNIEDVDILCNDVQISQVILNFLNNAHDAVKDNDEKWVRLSTTVVNDTIEIYISDSGSIDTKSLKEKIFEPFFTTKTKGNGTGLGMSISKKIIHSHGGEIELIEEAQNTTFKIALPIHDDGECLEVG